MSWLVMKETEHETLRSSGSSGSPGRLDRDLEATQLRRRTLLPGPAHRPFDEDLRPSGQPAQINGTTRSSVLYDYNNQIVMGSVFESSVLSV